MDETTYIERSALDTIEDTPAMTVEEKIDAIYKKMCFLEELMSEAVSKIKDGGILGILSGLGKRGSS